MKTWNTKEKHKPNSRRKVRLNAETPCIWITHKSKWVLEAINHVWSISQVHYKKYIRHLYTRSWWLAENFFFFFTHFILYSRNGVMQWCVVTIIDGMHLLLPDKHLKNWVRLSVPFIKRYSWTRRHFRNYIYHQVVQQSSRNISCIFLVRTLIKFNALNRPSKNGSERGWIIVIIRANYESVSWSHIKTLFYFSTRVPTALGGPIGRASVDSQPGHAKMALFVLYINKD